MPFSLLFCLLFLIGFFATMPTACADEARSDQIQLIEANAIKLGTDVHIKIYARDRAMADRAIAAVWKRIDDLTMVLSDYEEESEVAKLGTRLPGTAIPVSEDLLRVIVASQELTLATDGAFDCTIGPVVRLWRRARRQHKLPDPGQIAEARALVGPELLIVDPQKQTVTLKAAGMRLDFGAIGKGFIADEALKVLRNQGCPIACVAIAGDIAAGDAPPASLEEHPSRDDPLPKFVARRKDGSLGWRIEMQPFRAAKGAGIAEALCLRNQTVSTSGDTFQYVEIDGVKYSHIVDPGTGIGLTIHRQVTAVASNGLISDGVDTALSVAGPGPFRRLEDRYPGLLVLMSTETTDGVETVMTKGFEDLIAVKDHTP